MNENGKYVDFYNKTFSLFNVSFVTQEKSPSCFPLCPLTLKSPGRPTSIIIRFDLLTTLSLKLFFKEMYRDLFGECLFVYWGLKA